MDSTMVNTLHSSRDVIIQTHAWEEAINFYEVILGLPVTHRSPDLVGFETGSFCLYVERGSRRGPVFEFLVADIQSTKRQLLAAGCAVEEEDPSLPRCYLRDPFGLVFNIGAARSGD
jgi:catechol 2,3-dioxygenase-like lactoylglutathione lyase family enzyme